MEEHIEQSQSNLTSHALRWGLIIGAINVILTLLIYLVDVTLMAEIWLAFVFLFLNIGLVIYAGINFRNTGDGFLSFKKAFGYSFLVLAITGLIGVLFRYLLFNFIDPDATQILVEASMDKTEAMLESFGLDEDQIEQSMDDAAERTANQFQLGGLFLGYLVSLIFSGIGALIIGAIIKKRNPEEEI